MELGTFGVWTTRRRVGAENTGTAAALAEELGYGTFWLGGSPRLTDLRPLLQATERIVVASGIVNVWSYEAARLAAEYAALEDEFPGRVLVGIGIGHPETTSDYTRPLSAMRSFLDGLDEADPPLPRERRILAALAPKMLALGAERSLGAIPYFVPVAHTRHARAALGPGPRLAPELGFVLDTDPSSARAQARAFASSYLQLSNYTNNLLRHGFAENDVANGGSDGLIDAVIPHGTADEIAACARAHLEAGADHVVLQAVGDVGIPRTGWTALADTINR